MKVCLRILIIGIIALLSSSSLFAQGSEEQKSQISTGMEPGKVYVGERIDLDVQDADIRNVLRLLAEVGGVNIVVNDQVKGKVTLRLKNVPWDQALDLLVSTYGLGMVIYSKPNSAKLRKYPKPERKDRIRQRKTQE